MYTVELSLPKAVITLSTLMGTEGFGSGGAGGDVVPAVGKVRAGLPEGNPAIIRPSLDACSKRAKVSPAYASEPAYQYKIPDTGCLVHDGERSSFPGIHASEDFKLGNVNATQSWTSSAEIEQLQQRSGKVSRCISSGSKRSRIIQLELSMNESGTEDINSSPSGTGSFPAKYIVAEKTQVPKQRNNSNSKRGEKRNSRVPKSRCDSFSLKNGLVSFSSVAGGGNFLVHGSKSDSFDITKLVDEPSLNELLDGSYNCPTPVTDKGKAVEISNDSLLHSVKKACSVLRLQNCVRGQNSGDADNCYNQKTSVSPFSPGACPSSQMDGGKADSCTLNQLSSNKDSCHNMKPSVIAGDSPLCPPKDILVRLALPPSKDLDSLLLDAVKPASSSRNGSDLRFGKTVSQRTGLPPLPWSHNSAGPSKSGLDTVKLSASRTTCPARWVKVGNTLTPLEGSGGLLVDLKSLTYDHRLVPSENLESAAEGVCKTSSTCLNITSCKPVVSSSAAACSASQGPLAEYSPRLLAAAQTLSEIASPSLKENSHDMMKWLKKPSQKTMKACKFKLRQKSEELFVAPKASTGPDNLVKVADGMFPAKKLTLTVDVKPDAVCHMKSACKEPGNSSAPRSIRSPLSKPLMDSFPKTKNCNNDTVKKSYLMPPPTRVIDKACNSRQKLKKIVPVDWNTTGSNLD